MNIRVDLNTSIKDGTEVVFRSPVDCSQVTGLKVYYIGDDGVSTSTVFMFADAHGFNVGDINYLFAENVVVKVILDVTTGMAFVQNADTNTYLEERFSRISDRLSAVEPLADHVANKSNPHNVTREQLGAASEEYVQDVVDHISSVGDALDNHISATEAVIVTVSGSTPSHTSQDIYAAIQAGKAVYLHLWGNTYLGIAACVEGEARFEDSIIATITGADGETYSTQRYRMYYVKGNRYSTNSYEMATKAYVDAQIAYYLNQ